MMKWVVSTRAKADPKVRGQVVVACESKPLLEDGYFWFYNEEELVYAVSTYVVVSIERWEDNLLSKYVYVAGKDGFLVPDSYGADG